MRSLPACLQWVEWFRSDTVTVCPAAGIQVSEGGTFDVPVVFRPKSALRKQAWLSVTMKPVGSNGVAGAESERCVFEPRRAKHCEINPPSDLQRSVAPVSREGSVAANETEIAPSLHGRCCMGCNTVHPYKIPRMHLFPSIFHRFRAVPRGI